MGIPWRLLLMFWERTQVELQGKYSDERVLELTKYANGTSWLRVLGILVVTPLPCLLVTILVDVIPLARPSEGVSANSSYFLRTFCTFLVVSVLVISQFRVSVPVLPYPLKRLIGHSVLVSACIVGILYGFATTIGFPLPFSLLVMAPFWAILISSAMATEWAKTIGETPGARTMLFNAIKLWLCELLLVFTYPPYFYAFTTLPKRGKTAFAMLLPLIKLFMRNIFARTVTHLSDEMPEVVVFSCDVFNALFVSYCMQNSPSLWITLEIMLFDILMMAFSLRGAASARRRLKTLERRIELDKSWRNFRGHTQSTFGSRIKTLDRACVLLGQTTTCRPTTRVPSVEHPQIAPMIDVVRDELRNPELAKNQPGLSLNRLGKIRLGKAAVHPVMASSRNGHVRLPAQYTRKVQQLVYAAEFLLLVNYVEVIIPFVFSIYLFVMYHLPNGDYYVQIHGMNRDQLIETLQNVQFYCSLQLVSLLLLFFALQQFLGLSPIHQLAFVLEKQYKGVQIKLVFWVFYNVQASLQHNGYDYTFQFPWLQRSSDSQSA